MSRFEPRGRIVIVGGGFSGVLAAVNFVRLSSTSPARRLPSLVLVNGGRPLGRGVAYGSGRPEHLLNVAARNMSAFPDRPDHFVGWLRTRSEFENLPEDELREKFVPRIVYGDYLRSLVHAHLDGVEFVEGEAVDFDEGGGLLLADGRRLPADRVVIACGNEPPAPLPGAEALADHPAWVGNPWSDWENRLPPYGGRIVVLGTGLTTVDAVVTLRAFGW